MAPKGTQVATGSIDSVPSFSAAQRQPDAPHTPGARRSQLRHGTGGQCKGVREKPAQISYVWLGTA
jgi:hypothetical protein